MGLTCILTSEQGHSGFILRTLESLKFLAVRVIKKLILCSVSDQENYGLFMASKNNVFFFPFLFKRRP